MNALVDMVNLDHRDQVVEVEPVTRDQLEDAEKVRNTLEQSSPIYSSIDLQLVCPCLWSEGSCVS